MADKYIKLSNGELAEQEVITSSGGVGDAGKIVGLDTTGRFSLTTMPTGVGPDTKSVTASEALTAGDIVNLWNDAGTLKVRKADASVAGKQAHGFVIAGCAQNDTALVYFDGTNTQLASLTPAATYWLSAITPGTVTATPPSGTGKVVQKVGFALAATELSFEVGEPIVLA